MRRWARRSAARWRSRLAPPTDWLGRARRAFLLLALIVLGIAAQAFVPATRAHPEQALMVVGGLGWLSCRWLWDYWRPDTSLLWSLTEGVALLLLGQSLGARLLHPLGLLYVGLLMSGLAFRTLSPAGHRTLAVTLVYAAAYLGAMLSTRSLMTGELNVMLALLPTPEFVLLPSAMHLLSLTLWRRARDARHQRVLLDVGEELLTAAGIGRMSVVAAEATRNLLEDDASQVWVATGPNDGLRIQALAPEPDAGDRGQAAALALPEDLHAALLDGETQSLALAQAETAGLYAALGLDEARPWLSLVPLAAELELNGLIVVASQRPIPAPELELVARLGKLVARGIERAGETEELGQREAAFRSLVRHVSDAILVIEEDSTICFETPALTRLLGYEPAALLGTQLTELIHRDDLAAAVAFFDRAGEQSGVSPPADWRLRRHDGSWLPVEAVANNLRHDRLIQGVVLTIRDISERKLLEAQIIHQAFHDPLTDLPNRTSFLRRLDEALARSAQRRSSLAVLFLDLDRFKVINDSLGHEAGDQLLTIVANRLTACLRPQDMVARLGGDEFAIVVDQIDDALPAVHLAERILERLQEPILLGGRDIVVLPSIGIAVGSAPRGTAADLVRHADVAMYEAKHRGRGRLVVFTQGLDAGPIGQFNLERDLRHALMENQLQIHYQPLIGLASGRVQEVEALVRWAHPTRGLLLPGEFIPLAEETGLIVPLGRWVLERACHQVRDWQLAAPGAPPLVLGVNLSVRQFRQPSLVDDVVYALDKSGLEPSRLRFEITESVALESEGSAITTLEELKQLGVKLAIDDFGVGYSALSVLKRFPIDTLKIDRGFIEGLGRSMEDTAMVRAVVAFAQALRLGVTAEGVETAEQVGHLYSLGCDHAQGYYFSRPLSHEAMTDLLLKDREVRHLRRVV